MKLNAQHITHICKQIRFNTNKSIVEINVTEHDGSRWTDDECNYNIYCIDDDYNVIWQIHESKTKPVSIAGETDSFCYLGKDNQGELIAGRFSGFVYKIDPETGEAEQTGFRK